MKPRVFISSTYYDLKYVRENLEYFIKQHGFDSVLFESGNVTFEHGKALDFSCYQEVDNCHMMILIIGGRYGSASSTETEIEIRKKYDDQYISITRNEFDTAQKKGLPCFIFIDKNVYSEYHTYKKNEAFFELIREQNKKDLKPKDTKLNTFNFAHVDSHNVFKFIDHVNSLSIKTFERAEEIVDYLRIQLAGMFFLYLDQLKKEVTNKDILNSVEQLTGTANKIDKLVEAVAEKIIDKHQLDEINNKQFDSASEIFSSQLDRYIDLTLQSGEIDKNIADKLSDLLINEVFRKEINTNDFSKAYQLLTKEIPREIANKIIKIYPDILVNKINLFIPYKQYKKNIEPFINTEEKRIIFKDQISNSFFSMLLPF